MTSQDNNLNFLMHFYQLKLKIKVQRLNMPHFKGFVMMNFLIKS